MPRDSQFDDQTVQPQIPLTHTKYDVEEARRGDFSAFSAEQYLSYVRDQAEQMPVVTRAENIDLSQYTGRQTKYMPQISSIQSCAEEHMPSKDWEQSVIESFQRLKETIQSKKNSLESIPRNVIVPAMKDERSWFVLCSDKDEVFMDVDKGNCTEGESDDDDDCSDENSYDEAHFDSGYDFKNDQKDVLISDGQEKSMEPVNQEGFVNEDSMRLLLEQRRIEIQEEERLKKENQQMQIVIDNERRRLLSEDKCEEEIGVILKERFGEAALASVAATNESKAILQSNFLQSPTVRWTEPMKPSVPLVLQFDQVLVQKLLNYNVSWIESSNRISASRSQWIYALLVVLELPVYQDTLALLRQLYRRCCNMRSTLRRKEYPCKDGDERGVDTADIDTIVLEKEKEKELASMNLLIVLTGLYYGQGENYD